MKLARFPVLYKACFYRLARLNVTVSTVLGWNVCNVVWLFLYRFFNLMVLSFVAIRKPERHVLKASHCGSKQQ